MSQLIKAKDLHPPNISGTVSVPLAELDRMRSEHAAAVKLAQQLESKQMEVLVLYFEQRSVIDDYHRGYDGTIRYKTIREEVGREYKNLNDVREEIKVEELNKIEKKLVEFNKELHKWKEADSKKALFIKELQEKNKILTNENQKLLEDSKSINEKLEVQYKELEFEKDFHNSTRRHLGEANKEIHELKIKKSFWYWLRNL